MPLHRGRGMGKGEGEIRGMLLINPLGIPQMPDAVHPEDKDLSG